MRRTWRPERATPIADALDDLLVRIVDEHEHPSVLVAPLRLPYRTGVLGLDQVCDGGLRAGIVTVLDCPLAAQSRALLYSTARHADVATLLAVDDVHATARWLLAGASGVPAELIRSRHLSTEDWDAIAANIEGLAQRELSVTDAPTMAGIGHLIEQNSPDVVIVEDLDRLGPVAETLESLVWLARSTGVAMLTAVEEFPHLYGWTRDGILRVTVVPQSLASRAALLSTDCGDGLTAGEVQIATLTGHAV